ncbi:TaqI-like C-terminal specificity domain-containing protein [Cloacibacterium sp. Arc13]|uniref:Eco57I restriction-modification methylase domain-containing protein n=1 Tax=unclassified Cloacibacterium TaxID=2620870 RepID=UPI00352F6D37
MSLFQKTIINKYLKTQNQENLNNKWDLFCKHFHNAEIQENIRNSKEEQYQGEFLIDLFVNVLGYTKNPTPNFNLTTEYKNVKDSKKADGAIIINDKVLAIIELKGTDTTDLGKVETQAFGYKNNQPDCKYVITSNFEKLRFYIDNAIEHLEFNLFELTKEQFELLYLCLAFENISADIPAKIKNESVSKEDEITKKLYKDYSVFKRELFQNLTQQNPDFDQLELFKKSQKLLDRLLFLFFGEDRGLLPPNSVRLILEQWNKLKDLDEYVPLYDRFKKYFGYLNTGFKGKQFDVFAYNGGLFKPDEILDNITIDDTLLYNHTYKLAEYDFASEVDVNILGHIFENSLNEIDEIKAQIEGQEIDKSKTKRKKDGVFYTPKYITKYIVENTVGKLCEEKKVELGIVEEDYFTDKKRQQKTKLALLQKLEDYRTWLHQITIIDPACGSGAFLNEALNFLIEEHKYIDELEAKLTGSSIAFTYHSESILENNLFGVDLNEESVEIAKLSLWLRTAEPNRKLNDLSNNIKCGNSLIDNPEIAGNKAFNWEKEFPQIFAKGGFDVVIGNPPYVDNRGFDKNTLYYLYTIYPNSFKKSGTDKFKTTKLNLIALFIELNSKILKISGLTSFIFHKNIFKTNSYTAIREYILNNYDILLLTDWGAGQFQDVVAETATFVLKKGNIADDKIKIEFFNLNNKFLENEQNQSSFKNSYEFIFGIYATNYDRKLLDKIENNSKILENFVQINNGIVTGNDKKYLSFNCENDFYKKAIRGKDIKRYSKLFENEYILYKRDELLRARDENIFLSNEKLVMQMINIHFIITYDNEKYYNLGTTYAITKKDNSKIDLKYLLSILNSELIKFYYLKKFTNESSLTNAISTQNLFNIPIKEISLESQQPFIEKADQMLSLNKELQEISDKFQRNLQREFSLETFSKKLQNWYELSFAEFLKELAKAKLNLTLSQKAEWEDYFLQEQKKALECQSRVNTTDKEIDQMVYELYGLTEEEIEIVERS